MNYLSLRRKLVRIYAGISTAPLSAVVVYKPPPEEPIKGRIYAGISTAPLSAVVVYKPPPEEPIKGGTYRRNFK